MRTEPIGYYYENGKLLVDEKAKEKVIQFFRNYLQGDSLVGAAKKAGIDVNHGSAKRLLKNRRYIGEYNYPPIVELEIFNRAEEELNERAGKLNRINKELEKPKRVVPTKFFIKNNKCEGSYPFSKAIQNYHSIIERS